MIFDTDPIKFPITGIGRYTYELAKCLQENLEISDLLFMYRHHLRRKIPIANTPSLTTQALCGYIQNNYFTLELYRLIAPWLKTYTLRKYPDAIYHSPSFYLPPNIGRSLATFHDLSVFTWPQCHPEKRVRFMQKELLLTIKRADILITNSEFTRLELAKYFNLPLSKVYTAKLASSDDFYPRTTEEIQRFLTPLGLKANNYCFFSGSIEPRKNIETLLNAYEQLPISLRLAIPLVITGFEGWCTSDLHKRFVLTRNAGWLHYLGYVKSTVLPYLFAGARSFIFPSLYEGFGLPVLEAMASGIPVVCSNSSSLPEVTNGCALMCSAKDDNTLTDLIQKSIEDNTWRAQAKINGINQAKNFSWKKCAQATIVAYQQL